jgi:hypothetical protein
MGNVASEVESEQRLGKEFLRDEHVPPRASASSGKLGPCQTHGSRSDAVYDEWIKTLS